MPSKGAFDGDHFIVLTKYDDPTWKAENKLYKTWKNVTEKYLMDNVSVDVEGKLRIGRGRTRSIMIVGVDLNEAIPESVKNLLLVEEVHGS